MDKEIHYLDLGLYVKEGVSILNKTNECVIHLLKNSKYESDFNVKFIDLYEINKEEVLSYINNLDTLSFDHLQNFMIALNLWNKHGMNHKLPMSTGEYAVLYLFKMIKEKDDNIIHIIHGFECLHILLRIKIQLLFAHLGICVFEDDAIVFNEDECITLEYDEKGTPFFNWFKQTIQW